MVSFNVMNFITITLIVVLGILALRVGLGAIGKTSPV